MKTKESLNQTAKITYFLQKNPLPLKSKHNDTCNHIIQENKKVNFGGRHGQITNTRKKGKKIS